MAAGNVVDKRVGDLLYQHIVVDGGIWDAVDAFLADEPSEEELQEARRAVDELEDKLAVLYDQITDLDPAAFKKATAKVTERLAEARDRLTQLEESSAGVVDPVELHPQVDQWFGTLDLRGLVEALDVST